MELTGSHRYPESMRAYRLAYDGTAYRGFQRQPDVPTVEDTLFDALRALDAYVPETAAPSSGAPVPDRPRGYAAAGRTDAGVSALAQTVAFDAPSWLSPRALNAELPADVRAWASADVPDDFHATHDAADRSYTYYLYAPIDENSTRERRSTGEARGTGDGRVTGERSDHEFRHDPAQSSVVPRDGVVGRRLEDERVERALDRLSGRHDVHNLTPDDDGTVRTVDLAAEREGAFLPITVTAGGFPRHLVRRLVTLVARVGAGIADDETIDRVLSPEPLPGHEGIPPAPATPLVLTDVGYPNASFERDPAAAASARAIFERRRIEHRVGARVSRELRDGVR